LLNYRGYGRSEGTSENEATLNLDGAAGLRYLVEERGVAPGDVTLVGYSLGSTVAAELATLGPCKAVALLAPLASARAQAARSAAWAPEILLSRMRNRFDTVGKIGRANCPVMVVHGDADRVIDVEQGRAVFEAAREPKELLVLPGARHWLPTSGRGYLDRIAAFAQSAK
jgi:pimeloyl-ACP methyl ester carboxylesterase